MSEEKELPRYKCHKEVWAIRIKSIEAVHDDGSATLIPAEEFYTAFRTNPRWIARFERGDDLGYYVLYKDGYESWSPTGAFEDGYTRVT